MHKSMKALARKQRDALILQWRDTGLDWFEIRKIVEGGSDTIRKLEGPRRGAENGGNMVDGK